MIRVLSPGLLTTVQDLGRPGFQRFGVSVGGALDAVALQLGNILVGNPPEAAGLEMTLQGPVLEAETDLLIAITGADLGARLAGKPVPLWKSLWWRKGELLTVRGKPLGARAYLSVAGGVDVPILLGSRSTYLTAGMGGWRGRSLRQGDRLPVGSSHGQVATEGRLLPPSCRPVYRQGAPIRVILGPHQDAFTTEALEAFFNTPYTVTPQMNRMGVKLDGVPLTHVKGADILSGAVTCGSIQVPADGQPILLLAERQTTGGYAQIATVSTVDLPQIAQALPGDRLRFQPVTLDVAQRCLRRQRQFLRLLRVHVGL
ncbi:hypothetical protein ADL26_03960 [Thermoactinomyces vulgaris]|jgi:antagonist of KipI|nr:hypothetical protein ADL26_03960 [Thermoactinomyces vulgaris]